MVFVCKYVDSLMYVINYTVIYLQYICDDSVSLSPTDSEDGSKLARTAVHCSVLYDCARHRYLGIQKGKTRREEVH